MSIENALAGIAVKDLGAAVRWYEKVFDRSADSQPMPEVAEWRFAKGGWIQVFQDAERAGSSSVTLAVDDLDETVSALNAKGIETTNRRDTKSVKTAMINDLDGNRIVLAEALVGSMAQ